MLVQIETDAGVNMNYNFLTTPRIGETVTIADKRFEVMNVNHIMPYGNFPDKLKIYCCLIKND